MVDSTHPNWTSLPTKSALLPHRPINVTGNTWVNAVFSLAPFGPFTQQIYTEQLWAGHYFPLIKISHGRHGAIFKVWLLPASSAGSWQLIPQSCLYFFTHYIIWGRIHSDVPRLLHTTHWPSTLKRQYAGNPVIPFTGSASQEIECTEQERGGQRENNQLPC